MSDNTEFSIMTIVLGVGGLIAIGLDTPQWVNAIGVFCAIWAHNIEYHRND